MKKINLLTAAVIAIMTNACASAESQPARKNQVLPPPAAPVRSVTQAQANFSVAGETATKPRIFFHCSNGEKDFCSKLAARLAGSVVLDQADIMLKSDGDIKIMLNADFELIDKTLSYYRFNCEQITVTIATKQKILTTISIKPAALPRKSGAQNAKNQYLTPAVETISPILKKTLEKIIKEHIAVSEVVFTLANSRKTPAAQQIATRINTISRILSTTPGIINFTNIRQDSAAATCAFRICYMKEEFPQGIVNVLNLKLAGK